MIKLFIKIITSILLLFLIALSLFCATASTHWGSEKIRLSIIDYFSTTSKTPISIGKIRLLAPFYIQMDDVIIGNPLEPTASCSRITAVPILFDLPCNRISFAYLDIKALTIHGKTAHGPSHPPVEPVDLKKYIDKMPYRFFVKEALIQIEEVTVNNQSILPSSTLLIDSCSINSQDIQCSTKLIPTKQMEFFGKNLGIEKIECQGKYHQENGLGSLFLRGESHGLEHYFYNLIIDSTDDSYTLSGNASYAYSLEPVFSINSSLHQSDAKLHIVSKNALRNPDELKVELLSNKIEGSYRMFDHTGTISGTIFPEEDSSSPKASITCASSIENASPLLLDIHVYDFKGDTITINGSITDFPISHCTKLLSLPEAQGNISGTLFIKKEGSNIRGEYSSNAFCTWLPELRPKGALSIITSGTIDHEGFHTTATFFDDATQRKSIDPLEISFSIPFNEEQIVGSAKGSCDFHTLLSPWLEQDDWVEGRVFLDTTISGNWKEPDLSGEILLKNGKLDILAIGGMLSDLTLHGTFQNQTIIFDTITAQDMKNGAFQGRGNLVLPSYSGRPFSWAVNAHLSHFNLVQLNYVQASLSGDCNLSGTSSYLYISSNAQVESAKLNLSKKIALPVPELDVVYIDRESTQKQKIESIQSDLSVPSLPFEFILDLKISTKNPLEISGRGLQSSWKGDFSLFGNASCPSITGSLHALSGLFSFAGKDFIISHGSVTSTDSHIYQSRLSITAHAELPHVAARVLLRGTLDDPKISLESNPMKHEKEILSLILFDKELGEISPLESLQLASTALTLNENSSPIQFLNSLKKTFGIDTLAVRSSSDPTNNNLSFQVGKQITKGVTLNLSKELLSDTNRVGLKVEVSKNIVAEAEMSDDAEGVVSIQWKTDF